jgi:ABC-type polysaccharide/polyol phosphate transport system ATPase subunit
MSYDEIVIDVHNLSKRYEIYATPRDRLKQLVLPAAYQLFNQTANALGLVKRNEPRRYYREFWALHDVSFQVRRGECIGIIGKNGSGKSTLLQIIAGTLMPTVGDVLVSGRITALLELGSGFNMDFTGRENVYLNASILGVRSIEMENRFDEIEAFADIGDFIDQPVKTYSSGMLMRLAFATQTALAPDILIVDEALAVGDMSFQIKCFARMNQLREKGTTILFVSHSLGTVLSFCDRALYLRQGKQVAFGPVADVARQYEQDCLAEKMVPRHSMIGASDDVLPTRVPATVSGEIEAEQLASMARDYRHSFLACAATGTREGSQTVTIESFVLVRTDGAPVELISPTEDVLGFFLLRFNADFEGCIHLSIHILDKCGSPLAVIRDSYFDETIQGKANSTFQGVMRFVLPLQAGAYYCRIAALLFPAGGKYKNGQFNFEQAEIADLIEHGAHFEVLPFVHHSIPAPILHETKLTLTRLKEYVA